MPPGKGKKRPRPSKEGKDKPTNSDDSTRSAAKTKRLIRGVERLLRREVQHCEAGARAECSYRAWHPTCEQRRS